jgi:hypothetical protein
MNKKKFFGGLIVFFLVSSGVIYYTANRIAFGNYVIKDEKIKMEEKQTLDYYCLTIVDRAGKEYSFALWGHLPREEISADTKFSLVKLKTRNRQTHEIKERIFNLRER